MMPLYGFLEGDTMGLLVLIRGEHTIEDLAEQLRRAARMRVAHAGPLDVWYMGRVLPAAQTVEACGLRPLDVVNVRARRTNGAR